jgi:hypothetical protein
LSSAARCNGVLNTIFSLSVSVAGNSSDQEWSRMKTKHKAKAQWPEPHYFVGSSEFIHAIGVLSASYNLLEFRLRQFLELYTHLPHPAGTQLFISSNNQERLNLLRMCVAKSAHPLRVRNRVMRFAAGYDACTQNRNILMHSETVPIIKSNGRQEVAFKKMSKKPPFPPNLFSPSIKELRKIADATNTFQRFGYELFLHVLQNFEAAKLFEEPFSSLDGLPRFALPNKPWLPKILSP